MPYAGSSPSSVLARTKRFRRGKVSKYKRGRYLTAADIPRILRSSEVRNHEMKFFDVVSVHATPGFMNQADYLTGIVQGTSAFNRTGREIHVEKVEFNLMAVITDTVVASVAPGDQVRVALIMDTECAGTGSAPNPATLYSASTYLTAYYNPDSFSRFKVLGDQIGVLVPSTSNAGGVCSLRMHKMCKVNKRVHFYNSSNTGTSTDCERNGLWLQFGSQYSNASFTGYVRVYFRDI